MNDDWTDYESHKRRTAEHVNEQRDRLIEAGKLDTDVLTIQGRQALMWLAGFDQSTVGGVVELLCMTRYTASAEGADFADWLASR